MKVKEIKYELAKKNVVFLNYYKFFGGESGKKLCFLPELFDFYFMIQNLYINNHSF